MRDPGVLFRFHAVNPVVHGCLPIGQVAAFEAGQPGQRWMGLGVIAPSDNENR